MPERHLPTWTRAPLSRTSRAATAGLVAVAALTLAPSIAFRSIVARIATFGVLGWVLEATYEGQPRYSAAFAGKPVPFLPVYAVGGTAILAAVPYIAGLPFLARGLVYAAGLTAIEWGACKVDRATGNCSWDYEHGCTIGDDGGCVDARHAAGWGVLGLLVEQLVR